MLQRSLRQFADHVAQREDHRGRERLGVVAMAAAITMFTRLQQGCQRGEVLLPQEFRRCFVLHFPVVRKWTEIGTRRMFGVRKLFYSMLASSSTVVANVSAEFSPIGHAIQTCQMLGRLVDFPMLELAFFAECGGVIALYGV